MSLHLFGDMNTHKGRIIWHTLRRILSPVDSLAYISERYTIILDSIWENLMYLLI